MLMMHFPRTLPWTAAIRTLPMESANRSRKVPQTRSVRDVSAKKCGAKLEYSFYHYSQLGDYKCPSCGFARPAIQYDAHDVKVGDQLSFQVEDKHLTANYKGFYNVYNILAAYAGLRTAGFSGEHFQDMLNGFNPENGRMEQFRIKGTGVMLNLAKNPQALTRIFPQ